MEFSPLEVKLNAGVLGNTVVLPVAVVLFRRLAELVALVVESSEVVKLFQVDAKLNAGLPEKAVAFPLVVVLS